MTTVKKPAWPVNQLVTFELRDLRACPETRLGTGMRTGFLVTFEAVP
jgi:hypothetical protein